MRQTQRHHPEKRNTNKYSCSMTKIVWKVHRILSQQHCWNFSPLFFSQNAPSFLQGIDCSQPQSHSVHESLSFQSYADLYFYNRYNYFFLCFTFHFNKVQHKLRMNLEMLSATLQKFSLGRLTIPLLEARITLIQ